MEKVARSRSSEVAGLGTSSSKRYEPTSAKNASRNASRMVRKLGLYWKIPISEMKYEVERQTILLPYHSPIDICKYLLSHHPEILCGGLTEGSEMKALMASWWEGYRAIHGSHRVFKQQESERGLATTIPVTLYGDEGRGKRRGNTCVVSMDCVFGLGTASNAKERKRSFDCSSCKPEERTRKKFASSSGKPVPLNDFQFASFATTTMKEHSFLSRIPLFVVPCSLYKEYPDLIQFMLGKISNEMKQLFFEGVEIKGQVWSIAVIGMKGDAKWLAQVGSLTRYYAKKGRVNSIAMCPECWAGMKKYPYEDLTEEPSWLPTLYKSRPWDEDDCSCLVEIPFDNDQPERILKRDFFHTTRLGVYRHYIGSVIATLIKWRYFKVDGESNAVPDQLTRAHGYFRLWCSAFHHTPALRSFTKAFFNWNTASAFPWVNAKGSDVTLLYRWLQDFLPIMILQSRHPEHKQSMEVMLEVGQSMSRLSSLLYNHKLFLTRDCTMVMLQDMTRILNGYAWLANQSVSQKRAAFALVPKVHIFRHFSLDAQLFLKSDGVLFLSPLAFSCEMGEDLIGRLCKLSRRCDTRTVQRRVLEFYSIKAKLLHDRWKHRRGASKILAVSKGQPSSSFRLSKGKKFHRSQTANFM